MNDRWHILEFAALPSTSDFLQKYDDDVPIFCIAKEQFSGRGRHQRVWESPKGGLYASFSALNVLPTEDAGWMPLATGVTAAETLGEFGVDAVLKWPNDLLVNGKKIGGILSQMRKGDSGLRFIVGTGINVNNRPTVEGATSVREVMGREADLGELTTSFVNRVADMLSSLPGDLPEWKGRYRTLCSTIGKNVTVETPRGAVRGVASGIGDDGGLLIDTGSGTERVLAGDCLHTM